MVSQPTPPNVFKCTCFGHQMLERLMSAVISTEAVNTFVYRHQGDVAVHAGMDSMLSTKRNVLLANVSCRFICLPRCLKGSY